MKTTDTAGLKRGRRVALFAIAATLLLVVMKAVVGTLFNSQLLVADAFHSGSDILTHCASFFGLWLASHKKTIRFPYGLYKAETIASFTIGILISLAGIELFRDGYHRLYHLSEVRSFPILPMAACLISALISFTIAQKQKAVGKSIGSQALKATSKDALMDAIASLVVLSGVWLTSAGIPYVEGSIVMGISLLIIKVGVESLWTSLLILLDANLDSGLQSKIEERINHIYGVHGVGKVKIRQSGPFKIVECTITTSPSLSLNKAHELSEKVEDFIAGNYEHIESVFVHIEPDKESTRRAVVPVQAVNGLDSIISRCFARAPSYAILRLDHDQVDIEDFYYNENLQDKMHIGVKIVRALIQYKIQLLFSARIGEISYHMLKDSFVEVFSVEEGLSVKEIVERYRSGRLESTTGPTHGVEESCSANA